MLFSIEIKQGLIPVSGRHSEGLSPKTAETGIKQYRSISHNNRFACSFLSVFTFVWSFFKWFAFTGGFVLQTIRFFT